jgi:hypothetical protein
MFQKTVSTVAIIILIIALCFIGIALYRAKYNSAYPPTLANCPDYWDISGNDCMNSMGLGNPNCNVPMDFTKPNWSGKDGLCNKYTWATSCNLTWDGITDNVDACPTSESL